jgi:hypothetical protein
MYKVKGFFMLNSKLQVYNNVQNLFISGTYYFVNFYSAH